MMTRKVGKNGTNTFFPAHPHHRKYLKEVISTPRALSPPFPSFSPRKISYNKLLVTPQPRNHNFPSISPILLVLALSTGALTGSTGAPTGSSTGGAVSCF